MPERIAKRVLLVGWDAADWQVARPLIEAGQMPTLAGMMGGGVHGNLASLEPILSPMLWNSIATGKTADQHGICGFTEPLPDGTGIRPVSSRSRRCKALWNILSQNRLRSKVVGWYASHPAEPIRGVMVSNQFEHAVAELDKPWPIPVGAVHPPGLADELGAMRVHPAEIDAGAVLPFVPDARSATQSQRPKIGKLRSMLAQTASIHAVATKLLSEDDWDFAAVYYEGIDRFGHEFMEFHPPKMPQVADNDFRMFNQAMVGIYRFHDMMLDALLQIVGPETVVIVMSDHGYYNDHLRPDPAKAGPVSWHRPIGMVCMAGAGIKSGERVYGASLLDATPTVLRLLGLSVGSDMRGRPWVEAFEQPVAPSRIPTWETVEGDDGRHAADVNEDPAVAREALQQLIDLGYVAPPSDDVQESVEDAVASNTQTLALSLMSLRRPADALEQLDSLPERHRQTPSTRLQRALCLLGMGRITEARGACDALIAEGGGAIPRAEVLMGMLSSAEGRQAKALEHFERVAGLQPDSVDIQTRLARAYLAVNEPAKARSAFERVLDLDEDNAVAYDGLAQSALALGDADDAVTHALRAVELMFHFPRAHMHLGKALLGCGQAERAAEALRVCIGQASGFHEAHKLLAQAYDRIGLDTKAEEQRLLARRQHVGTATGCA